MPALRHDCPPALPGGPQHRHRLAAWLLLPLLWLAALAMAAEGEPQPVPALRAPLTDLAGVLRPADAEALNRKLLAFAQEKGSQIGVLIVPTTAPEDIFSYSFRVAEAWQLGRRGVDDGVLLVVAVNDRRTHLQVGYGLEGAIPDIRANQIVDDILPPYFRRGDFAGGINAAVDALIKLINGESLPPPKTQASGDFGGRGAGGGLLVALMAGVFTAVLARLFLGRLLGSLAGGGVAFALALALGLALGAALMVALFAIFLSGAGRGVFLPGGFGSGGFGGGLGGGFGGGGGGFGGGGAGGRW